MKNVLIVYTTNSGSTEEIAGVIAEELGKNGDQVSLQRLEQVDSLDAYDAVVIGAPMILGWHRMARNFVRKHQPALAGKQVAYFFTAMRLTQTPGERIGAIPLFIDPVLARPPEKPGRMSFKERYATPVNYLTPVLKSAPKIRPVSAAFFGGKLELFRLHWLQMLFVMLVIRAQPGDFRNWPAIREWAGGLRSRL